MFFSTILVNINFVCFNKNSLRSQQLDGTEFEAVSSSNGRRTKVELLLELEKSNVKSAKKFEWFCSGLLYRSACVDDNFK